MDLGISFGRKRLNNKSEQGRVQSMVERFVHAMCPAENRGSVMVMVTEIECNEIGCAPIETLVILLSNGVDSNSDADGKGRRKWAEKILKPLVEVAEADVAELLGTLEWSDGDSFFTLTGSPEQNSDKKASSESKEKVSGEGKTEDDEYDRLISDLRTALAQAPLAKKKLLCERILNTIRESTTAEEEARSRGMESEKRVKIGSSPPPPEVPKKTSTVITMRPKVASEMAPESSSNSPALISTASSPSQIPPSSKNEGAVETKTLNASSSGDVNSLNIDSYNSKSSSSTNNISQRSAPEIQERQPIVSYSKPSRKPGDFTEVDTGPAVRHNKGVRARGCPCCDPDNLDNIVDKMLFMNTPP